MDTYEATVHSFVVKVWLEETAEEAGRATWRGQITHVANGRRYPLRELDDIAEFVAPYLEAMGVHVRRRGRWMLSLRRWRRSLRRRLWSEP